MTDNTQELDEIFQVYIEPHIPPTTDEAVLSAIHEAKQAIIDWHNKQVKNAVATAEDNLDQYWNKELDKQIEGVLDRAKQRFHEPIEHDGSYISISVIDKTFDELIQAERAKLKEVK